MNAKPRKSWITIVNDYWQFAALIFMLIWYLSAYSANEKNQENRLLKVETTQSEMQAEVSKALSKIQSDIGIMGNDIRWLCKQKEVEKQR